MHALSLDTFTSGGPDQEANQYRILHGIKTVTGEFARNRLYPSLTHLIDLLTTITSLLQETSLLEQRLPGRITGVDVRGRKLLFEKTGVRTPELERVTDLMRWAIPHLQEAIEEGTRIYDFVDEGISVEEVGILPMYRSEGYCFVPDHLEGVLRLLRYEASLYSSGSERFRTLKTSLVRSIRFRHVRPSPESLKLELIESKKDLPNPATYLCETSLEFPFHETILPVAKRKLMARIFS